MNRAEPDTAWLGAYGELVAASYLRAKGMKVLRRNWQPPRGGELDLVCRDDERLVFVEVKTRTSQEFGGGRRAVNARKRALIRQGAREWLRMLWPLTPPTRYDVVEVWYRPGELPQVTHMPGAFGEYDLRRGGRTESRGRYL